MIARTLLILATGSPLLFAESRTSARYTLIQEETAEGGGGTVSAGRYRIDTSTGNADPGGVSSSGPYVLRSGFIGSLADFKEIAVLSSNSGDPVPEISFHDESVPDRYSATFVFDDGSTVVRETVWQVLNGPIRLGPEFFGEQIVNFDPIFENRSARLQATMGNQERILDFQIRNTRPDNYREYAGDGLEDSWQVGFFGQPPRLDAGPDQDPDGDGDNNLMEFLTGHSPSDSGDRFGITLTKPTSDSAQVTLSKVIPGISYVLQRSTGDDALVDWSDIATFTTTTTELDFPVTDTTTAEAAFYRVVVSPAE